MRLPMAPGHSDDRALMRDSCHFWPCSGANERRALLARTASSASNNTGGPMALALGHDLVPARFLLSSQTSGPVLVRTY